MYQFIFRSTRKNDSMNQNFIQIYTTKNQFIYSYFKIGINFKRNLIRIYNLYKKKKKEHISSSHHYGPASFQKKKKNNQNSMVDSIGASMTEKLHGRRNVYAILTNLVYSIQSVIACRSRAVETHSLEFFSFALVLCARTNPVRFIRYRTIR